MGQRSNKAVLHKEHLFRNLTQLALSAPATLQLGPSSKTSSTYFANVIEKKAYFFITLATVGQSSKLSRGSYLGFALFFHFCHKSELFPGKYKRNLILLKCGMS